MDSLTGSAALAVFYILAQVVERIVEIFSYIPIPDENKKTRTWVFWGISSMLGWGVCAIYNVDFFSLVHVQTVHHGLNIFLSGIIVGSGTKPVHDLISSLEKYTGTKKS